MNWGLCIICQQRGQEINLQCPANSKRKDCGAGYASFVANLIIFQDLSIMPVNLNIDQLDDGSGIGETLFKNKASWHKSCREMFSNTKLQRAQKRKKAYLSELVTSPVKARRSSLHAMPGSSKEICIFCDEDDSSSTLHAASTFEVDRKVRECAVLLNDGKLLAKLSSGDMMAIDAKYHSKCLVSLYNQTRQFKSEPLKDSAFRSTEGIAFAELIAYIDDSRDDCQEPTVFKLADLA